MAIIAALMTAIAAAEFVLLIVMAGNRSDSARVAELQAALDYAVEHVSFLDRWLFICAYRNGDKAILQERFPTWATFRDQQVALALDTAA